MIIKYCNSDIKCERRCFVVSVANDYSGVNLDLNSSPCFVHADFNEAGISVSMALCVSDVRRKHVYTSSTNELEMHIVNENQDWTIASGFIFEFEGIQLLYMLMQIMQNNWQYYMLMSSSVMLYQLIVIIRLLKKHFITNSLFTAFGCPDPSPPANGYFERQGEFSTIRCENQSDISWEISCQGTKWVGETGTCVIGIKASLIAMIEPNFSVSLYC